VFNQAFGMVAVTDQPAKRAERGQWNAKTYVWTAALPAGREPYAAVLLEGRPSASERFTIGLVELPADRK
jgi:hypothetical protein